MKHKTAETAKPNDWEEPRALTVFSSVQSLSHVRLCDPMNHRPPCSSPTPRAYSNSCPSSRWCHPAISSCHPLLLTATSPSQHQDLFKWVSSSHQVAKVLELQLQHQSFQWTPRTDLLRMDWLDLLAVQGTLQSLQHHSSKAPVFQCSAFFTVQLTSIIWLLEKP